MWASSHSLVNGAVDDSKVAVDASADPVVATLCTPPCLLSLPSASNGFAAWTVRDGPCVTAELLPRLDDV